MMTNYDRFLTEQLAGDELESNEVLTATRVLSSGDLGR